MANGQLLRWRWLRSTGASRCHLSSHWRWRSRSPGTPIVGVLSGGAMCAAAHVARSLVVTFACGAGHDALSKVAETSTCVYEATLTTPAACEDVAEPYHQPRGNGRRLEAERLAADEDEIV